MSTAHDVEVLIGAALMLVAGGLAIPGWVTNRPDNADRYRLRFLACCFMFAGWALVNSHPHGWWAWTGYLVGAVWIFGRAQHWWRAMDKARKAEAEYARLVAAYRRGVSGG